MGLTIKQRILAINNKIAVAVSISDGDMWAAAVQEWKDLMIEIGGGKGSKKNPW